MYMLLFMYTVAIISTRDVPSVVRSRPVIVYLVPRGVANIHMTTSNKQLRRTRVAEGLYIHLTASVLLYYYTAPQ